MDLNDNFVEVFKKSYEEVYNKESKIVGSPAGCDSRTWKNIAKCPTLQYGPGSIKQCHTVNEYLNIDEYLESILLYSNIVMLMLLDPTCKIAYLSTFDNVIPTSY